MNSYESAPDLEGLIEDLTCSKAKRLYLAAKRSLKRLVKDPLFIASCVVAPILYPVSDKITHFLGGIAAYRGVSTLSEELGFSKNASIGLGVLSAFTLGYGWEMVQLLFSNGPDPLNKLVFAGAYDFKDVEATLIGGIANCAVDYVTKEDAGLEKVLEQSIKESG